MSFFDDDDDEDIPQLPPPLPRTTSRASATSSRQPSVISESSRAESSRAGFSGGNGRYPSNGQRGGAGGGPAGSSRRSPTRSLGPTTDNEDFEYDPDYSLGDSPNGNGQERRPGAGGRRRGESMSMSIQDDQETQDGVDFDLEEDEDMSDVVKMGKVWVKERGTTDIMPWEGDLIDALFDKLEQQAKMVNTLRSDPQTSEEEHFKLVLVQTEMERVKYLIRSYVRCRLSKIEKFAQYIVSTPALHSLLSGAELSHARRYIELLHTHFQHSVLDSLPEWLRKMDDSYGDGLSMVAKPNKNVPVLIYCRKDCGEILLEGGEAAALAKGTTHLVKYNLVEQWIKLGWAEVL